MSSSVPSLAAATSAVARFVSCLRPSDVLVLQGPPLLGAAFALGREGPGRAGEIGLLVAANVSLMAHVFSLNDWSNLAADAGDPNKAGRVFTSRGISGRPLGALTGGLLLASLVLFAGLGRAPLGLALAIAALSALYSLPLFDWKGRPVLSSATHLLGGTLHFQLGYSLGDAFDARGWLIAGFIGVTFAAGHLAQEVGDYDGDASNGIQTNAVAFGRRPVFLASLTLFTLSHGLLLALALVGRVPRALAGLAALYPLHLVWSFEALRGGLSHVAVTRLRQRYRGLYALIGVAILAALWLE